MTATWKTMDRVLKELNGLYEWKPGEPLLRVFPKEASGFETEIKVFDYIDPKITYWASKEPGSGA